MNWNLVHDFELPNVPRPDTAIMAAWAKFVAFRVERDTRYRICVSHDRLDNFV